MKNHHSQKAYKKCIICGSNFVTSETDSEVFCKDCQNHRDTAKTLQNLLEHINPNEKFSIGDLIPYYKFSALNNIVNALMDDGLLDFNPNDNTYSLKDKRVLDDFLNKYLIDPETAPQPIDNEYPYNYTKEHHEAVIKSIQDGKTRKEAAKLAGINFRYLERWYIEGQKGIEPFKQYYKDYELNKKDPKKKSEEDIKKETEEFNLNKLKIHKFINSIKNEFTVKKSAEISGLNYKQVQKWLYYGNREKEPFNEFSKEYKDAKKEAAKNRNTFKKSEVQRDAFIVHIKTGFSMTESCRKADLKVEEVLEWIEKGEDDIKPYVKFYEAYQKAKGHKKNKTTFEKDREQYTKEKHETIINTIKEGRTITEAVKLAGISIRDENRWYTYGQKGLEPFKQYYEDYNFWKKEGQKKEDIKKERSEFLKNYKKINIFIKAIMGGKNFNEAIQISELNEKKLQKWLDYGKHGIEPFKITFDEYEEAKNKKSEDKTYSHKYTKKRHEIVINAIKEGKTRREAAELADITINELNNWYNKGKQGIEPFKQYYEDYELNKINPQKKKEERLEKETEEFLQKYDERKKFFMSLREGKSVKESARIAGFNLNQINRWIKYGKDGIEPFQQFYEYYEKDKIDPNKKIKEENIKKLTKEFEQKTAQIKLLLKLIQDGKTVKKSANTSGLDFKEVQYWIHYGKQGIEPFKQFFIEYKKARDINWYEDYSEIREPNEKIYSHNYTKERHNIVINAFKEGKTRREAAELAGVTLKDLGYWHNAGANGKEPFKQYYEDYKKYKIDPKKMQEERIKKETEKYNQNSDKLNKYLIAKNEGNTRKEAAKMAELDEKQIERWLGFGRRGIEPFKQFFNEYYNKNNLKQNPEEKIETKVEIFKKAKDEKSKSKSLVEKSKYNKKRHEIVINAIKEEKTRKESAALAGVALQDIEKWYNYGKQGIEPFKQYYEDYITSKPNPKKKKEERIKREREEFEQKIHKVGKLIETIENGKTIKESIEICELNQNQITLWLSYGRKEIDPFKQFLDEYNQAKEKRDEKVMEREREEILKETEIFEQKTNKIYRFISAFENGKSREKAIEISGLDEEEVARWLRYGRKGIEPFNHFSYEFSNVIRIKNIENKRKNDEKKEFKKYLRKFLTKSYDKELEPEILINSELVKRLKNWKMDKKEEMSEYKRFLIKCKELEKTVEKNLVEFNENKLKIGIFLNELKNHSDEDEALKNSKLKKTLVIKWKNKGEKNIKPYKKFYESINYIKLNQEYNLEEYESNLSKQEIFLKEILDETPEEDALKISGLEKGLTEKWIELGNSGIEPFREFLIEYNKAKRRANAKINKFKRKKGKRAIFIEYIEEKYSMSQACREAKLEPEDVEDWLIKGKNGQKPYVEFHKEYENARMASTKKPVPKRYVKSRKKSIKNNKAKLKLNVIKETKNLLDVSIEGNIPTSSMDLVNNIMKTYNAQINTSVINRLKNNQLKIYIELTIQKEELGFIKSLIKSY